MRSRCLSAVMVGVACVVVACGCGRGPGDAIQEAPARLKPNVVVIIADALRADHTTLYGYDRATTPNLASWFRDATVYERAYASASYTPPSVVSILSGLVGPQHGIQSYYATVPQDLNLISTRLAEAGYETCAVVSNPVLSAEFCGLDAHFAFFDDEPDAEELNRELPTRSAGATTDAALGWLAARRDATKPHFLYVHYFEPHGPYTPPPDKPVDFTHQAERPVPRDRIPEYQRIPGVLDGLEYVDLYDEEIAYLDREVARLLDGYAKMYPVEDTLVIFSSDHGESLMDHDRWFRHSYQVYEELIRVPLAVRGPGFGRARVRTPVSIVDIAPTILSAAGVTAPKGLQGEALTLTPREGRFLFSESQWELCCAVRGEQKWLAVIKEGGSRMAGWYDLAQDPEEKRLLKFTYDAPEVLRFFEETFKPRPKASPAVLEEVSEKKRQVLEAMGYL